MEQNDYYCEICDSHMNSLQMWESHIDGKRHLKNLKKEPGEAPSKVKLVQRDDVEPYLSELLMGAEGPVIGLEKIAELRKLDPSSDPTYACYSCNGSFTKSTIVPHIVSTKHRMQYLREADPQWYSQVQSMQMRKPHTDALAEEKAHMFEIHHGRGRVQVKVEKSLAAIPPKRRPRYVDLDNPATASAYINPNEIPLGPAPVLASEVKGIEDFDIMRDVEMISADMRIEIMKAMLDVPLSLDTEEHEQQFVEGIKNLQRIKVLHRVRQLAPDTLDKLYKDVTNPEPTESLWSLISSSRK